MSTGAWQVYARSQELCPSDDCFLTHISIMEVRKLLRNETMHIILCLTDISKKQNFKLCQRNMDILTAQWSHKCRCIIILNKYMHYLFIVSITYYINLQRCFIWLITQATCIALSVLFTLSSPFSVRRCLTTRLLQILKNRSIWKLKLFNCMFKIISICKTISRAIG